MRTPCSTATSSMTSTQQGRHSNPSVPTSNAPPSLPTQQRHSLPAADAPYPGAHSLVPPPIPSSRAPPHPRLFPPPPPTRRWAPCARSAPARRCRVAARAGRAAATTWSSRACPRRTRRAKSPRRASTGTARSSTTPESSRWPTASRLCSRALRSAASLQLCGRAAELYSLSSLTIHSSRMHRAS